MILRRCTLLKLPLWALLAAGLLALPALPGRSDEQSTSREQEIAEIQKQIDALNKKLSELRRASQAPTPAAKVKETLPADWVKSLTWRNIGPANMSGRIVALSVCESDPSTWWVATASGGLLKTTNNGITFEHQFDKEATVSLGDVCVAPSDRNIVWVGTGENNPRNSVSYGDGVYKSTDGGKTWKHMGLKKSFQVGKIVVHPKDPNTVYVGALGRLYGPNPERGLYKTTDGGQTWERILYVDDRTGVIDLRMHPTDPDTLLVATWERQRDAFDSHVGDPPLQEGYDGYDPVKKWGPGSGIYKTTDGGKTWKKVSKGLPTSDLGRIGLDWYRKDPQVVYAIIDCARIGMGTPPKDSQEGAAYLGVQGDNADAGARLTQVVAGSPAEKAGLKVGDIVIALDGKIVLTYEELVKQLQGKKAGDRVTFKVARAHQGKDLAATLAPRPETARRPFSLTNLNRPYEFAYGGQRENVQDKQGPNSHEYGGIYKSTDGGESWTRINSLNPRPMYFSQIRVDPSDDKYLYVCGISLYRSTDGGKTFKDDGGNRVHPDHHALWVDPRDGRHLIVGCDGGVYVTHDRMDHWDFHNHAAIGQFYHVCVDNRRPYRVYGGLQDNGSWGGPSRSLSGAGPINEDWITVGGGDGFVCRVDPNDPDVVYAESQNGFIYRRNLRTGERGVIRPEFRRGSGAQSGLALLDSLPLLSTIPARSLPFLPESVRRLWALNQYRFNWNTPFILSSHNPSIIYSAGNHVFRSVKRGEDLKVISPEITRTERGSGTALSESPRNPDILWAGTDDGYVWVTRDGGSKWTNVTPPCSTPSKGGATGGRLPGPRWVASIEASRFANGRAYVVFDGHRSDDDNPYVFVTEDYGQTWKPLRGNLPWGSTRVLREDVENPNLLYLGTEFAVWCSLDRGQQWVKLNNNLPTVAVHEIAVHPTAGEIVAATHGRSLWILDVTPLRQMTPEALKASAFLYEPNVAVRWRQEPARGSMYGVGSRLFVGTNPPDGAQIYYSLTKKANKISLKAVDIAGKTVRNLEAKAEPGLHRVTWDLRAEPERQQSRPGARSSRFRRGGGRPVSPGSYRLVLTVDGQELGQNLRVEADPSGVTTLIAEEEEVEPRD